MKLHSEIIAPGSTSPTQTDLVESPGALLAAARVRAGLSLTDVAERSRVGLGYLEALEADDWEALPAPVYTRGFMRLYAREVGLDPEAVVARLDTLMDRRTVAEERVHQQVEREERRAWWAALRMRSVYGAALGALAVVFLVAMFGISPRKLEAAPTLVLPDIGQVKPTSDLSLELPEGGDPLEVPELAAPDAPVEPAAHVPPAAGPASAP